jgi:hypothetical protein
VVIDLDVAKDGSGQTGQAALERLCADYGQPWPGTYTVDTPSGGAHLYYRASPDQQIGNSTGALPKLIDVRGGGASNGGYVVGAGSVIPDGEYTVRGSVLALASLPGWLARLITDRPTAETPQVTGAVIAPDAYAQAALDAEAALVAAAPEGTRNDQLSRSAWTLARFPNRELPAGSILAVLGGAAAQAGLREPEIGRTIRSALRARRAGGAP